MITCQKDAESMQAYRSRRRLPNDVLQTVAIPAEFPVNKEKLHTI